MSTLSVHVQLLDPELGYPRYLDEGCAGLDLCAAVQEDVVLRPSQRALIPAGIKMEIPQGYEGQVRPRSGLALNYGITVLNSPGTIDASYRGEIKVILINLGQDPFTVTRGMRIAQLVIASVARVTSFIPVEQLSSSSRQEGGFGSTGLN